MSIVYIEKRYINKVTQGIEMSNERSRLILRPRSKNNSFRVKVEELSGEKLNLCFQCGACSSGCPLTQEMDLLPSKIIRYVQLGEEEVIDSKTIWICSTCFNCEVRCPRGINIANLMEALREIKLRSKYDHFSLDSLDTMELRELPQIALISSLRKMTA